MVLVFDEAGSLTNRYLHGPAVDQVFADEDAMAEILWGLGDNQGTIRDVADYDAAADTTSIANHRQFDSFGNLTAETNAAVDFAYAYTGRYFDPDTGLQYNRARWYDPAVGRWLSEDPIGFAAGDGNLARYVGNGPTNFVDPSGLADWSIELRPAPGTQRYRVIIVRDRWNVIAGSWEESRFVGYLDNDGLLYRGSGNSFGNRRTRRFDDLQAIVAADAIPDDFGDWYPSATANMVRSGDIGTQCTDGRVTQRGGLEVSRTPRRQVIATVRDEVVVTVVTAGVGRAVTVVRGVDDVIDAGAAARRGAAGFTGRFARMNPEDIRFSQNTAGGRGRAARLRESMRNGWNGPAVNAVQTADGIVTIDNTRIAVARELGITEVPVMIRLSSDRLPESMIGRFGDARTWGEALRFRTGSQRPPLPPTGTCIPPQLPN